MNEASRILEQLLAANHRYVQGTSPAGLSAVPSRHLAVVTCMDVRIDPLPLLGLSLGEAHVLRNAGARVTDDVVRSLVISQQALSTRIVLLMPHTRCGVLGLQGAQIVKALGRDPKTLPSMDFMGMDDLMETLRHDLARLRDNPWIGPDVVVAGVILDIDTYQVRPL